MAGGGLRADVDDDDVDDAMMIFVEDDENCRRGWREVKEFANVIVVRMRSTLRNAMGSIR